MDSGRLAHYWRALKTVGETASYQHHNFKTHPNKSSGSSVSVQTVLIPINPYLLFMIEGESANLLTQGF